MLRAKIRVDLPSVETQRSPGPMEWLRSLFGAQLDLRSGKEETTVCAFSLIEGLVAGFAKAGVDDVLSFLVDKRVVYVDTNDVQHDLSLIAKAAEAAGVLDRKFREMHLVLAHRDELLHSIIDCKITSQVVLGEAETQIVLSGRLSQLQVQSGESAEQYAERIQGFAAQESSFEPARLRLDQLTKRVAACLNGALVGSKVESDEAQVQLVRPDARQISQFKKLGFGEDVESPHYRPVPTLQRGGAYADPFYYYYYDPYYDYMNYVLVSSMLHQSMWHSHHVHVVDPSGSYLYSGDRAAAHANDSWVGNDAVSYDADGQLALNDTALSAEHGAWQDDHHGWLGASSSSGCGSSSSSCSSASSCSSGSSCNSASSCGSSCNSGSSCGSSCSSCGSSD